MSDWVVEIQDFQSIKKGKVTISSGLNIVTGPTNRGKSAIIRAIDGSIFNKLSDDLVRVGTSIAGVTISNGDHTMICCRNAKGKNEKTAYQFDGGTVQRKVGRSQLPEVKDMFGVSDIRLKNDILIKLNFWYQNDKPFLMDKTPGQLYEFFTLSSADKYVKVLKQMVTDIKVQEAEINNANSTIDTLKAVNNRKQDFISKNEGFDDLYAKIVIADSESKKLNALLNKIEILMRLQSQIKSVSQELEEISVVYNSIPISDIVSNYQSLIKSDSVYQKLYQELSGVASYRKRIGEVSQVLAESTNEFVRAEEVYNKVQAPISSLVLNAGKVLGLQDRVVSVQTMKLSIDTLSERINSIGTYDETKIPIFEGRLSGVFTQERSLTQWMVIFSGMKKLKDQMEVISSNIQVAQKSLSESGSELDRFKKEVGYCPFCGSVFCESNHQI